MPGGKREIKIGMIGAGFLADMHARCYQRVCGCFANITAVAARSFDHADAYAQRWGVAEAFDDYRRVLDLPDIDIIHVAAPNYLHHEIVIAATSAHKHVVCTKPLTGYFGGATDTSKVGQRTKRSMFEGAAASAREMVENAARHQTMLMYAENWIYAPAVQKARHLIQTSQGTILEIRGGEAHSGSHSPYSKSWRYTGGGALLRLASHPVGAALYLKRIEGLYRRARPTLPSSVIADTGDLSKVASGAGSREWLAGGWEDVENWGVIILTFDDGTKAVLSGSDGQLGGLSSALQISLTNARIECQMSPTDLCRAYTPDQTILGQEYLLEKLETSAGWSMAAPDEQWTHGHVQQIQDFVEAVANDRPPLSDGELGRQVVEVIYAAYVAAEEGRRVDLRALGCEGGAGTYSLSI